jgi:branched-chain amino acid transport system ATP-binding protein
MSYLSVRDIHYSNEGVNILNGISFEAKKGDIRGIIGPNGSGKTTFFNCLSGFFTINKGSVEFNGENITKIPAHDRARRGIGRVFQNFGIFREMTLLENIILAIEEREKVSFLGSLPFSGTFKRVRNEAHDYLKEVGLENKAGRKASTLSGGEMRLLEIIRTLAFGADLFLLDEPTAGVSPKMTDRVIKLLQDIHKQGKTIIVIEHDMNFISDLCDEIDVFDIGKVVFAGTPTQVRESRKVKEIYFGQSQK